MGDISIMARRLTDDTIQYGWCGNGGYFCNVGDTLLNQYDSPEMVDYLFSLGELQFLGMPHSENGGYGFLHTTVLNNTPHSIGKSEREMFSQVAFADYGYFYDSDNRWYYVIPGPVRVKMPLMLINNNLDNRNQEFGFCKEVERTVTKNVLELFLSSSSAQEKMDLLKLDTEQLRFAFAERNYDMYNCWNKYGFVFKTLDDWCVIDCDEEYKNVIGCKLKLKSDTHIETINW